VLKERPASPMVGASAAIQIDIARAGKLRKLEDGPIGGTLIHFGSDLIGYVIDAPLPVDGPWSLVRILDASLAQAAFQLQEKAVIWLPGMSEGNPLAIPISIVSDVGKVGPVHRDINGNTPTGGIRGPFQIESLKTKTAPTYPVLWSHDAKRERCMEFEADSEGIVRQGSTTGENASVKKKVDRVWSTASHCHFNSDFQFNSQSTAMQFTGRPTIGGNAWPSVLLNNRDQEKALTLWGNSSLGLLLHWWHANKQQAGRGRIGVSALSSMPVLDVSKLSKKALSTAVTIFDELKIRELRPINEIDRDPVRHEIDTRLCTEVLGLPFEITAPDGPLSLLRQKLALEPSIHGGKK
jgi:hypothetical protein